MTNKMLYTKERQRDRETDRWGQGGAERKGERLCWSVFLSGINTLLFADIL